MMVLRFALIYYKCFLSNIIHLESVLNHQFRRCLGNACVSLQCCESLNVYVAKIINTTEHLELFNKFIK